MMKGKDVTHNHPLSTPPSPEDLYLLVNYKVKSFRTCGENGTYVLEYNEQVEKLPDFKTFSDTYDEIIYELQDKYYDEVKHGMKKRMRSYYLERLLGKDCVNYIMSNLDLKGGNCHEQI